MSTPLSIQFNPDASPVIDYPGKGIIMSVGETVPADGSAGYAKGCIFIDVANAVVYINEGTSASSDFDAITTA